MKHNLIIECGPATSEQLKEQWEELANGVARCNAAWFDANPGQVDMPLPQYEDPRSAGGVADQRVGIAPVVRKRRKATCVEWAAYICGAMMHSGQPAFVKLIEARSIKYEKPVPFSYHAVVRDSTGQVFDVTADLPGYQEATMGAADQPWWERLGHCCADCALEEHGKKTPCHECAVMGSACSVCSDSTLQRMYGGPR